MTDAMHGRAPRVAAALLTWNNFADTAECLEGLRRSTVACCDVVVVDNGSTDDTAARLRAAFPEVRVVSLERNAGYTGGANRALAEALASGPDYVLFLANDTVPHPDLLAAALAPAERDPRVGLVGPRIMHHDAPGVLQHGAGFVRWSTGVLWKLDARSTVDCDWVTGCGFLVRASVLARLPGAPGFDDRFFAYWEDVDFSRRVAQAGFRIVYEPASVLLHKESEATQARESIVKKRSRTFYMLRNQFLFAGRHLTPTQRARCYARALAYEMPRELASWVKRQGFHPGDLAMIGRAYRDGVRGKTGRAPYAGLY